MSYLSPAAYARQFYQNLRAVNLWRPLFPTDLSLLAGGGLRALIRAVPEAHRTKILADIPVGRFGRTEEVASLASGLAGFITGVDLSINGGQHMG